MKRKSLISGAEYWDFNQEPRFIGYYLNEHKDDKGKLIGFDFVDEQGEPWIISNSHSIEKAVEMINYASDKLLEIVFKGKITVKSSGKPFNKFEVNLLEEENEPVNNIQTAEPQQEPTKKPKKG